MRGIPRAAKPAPHATARFALALAAMLLAATAPGAFAAGLGAELRARRGAAGTSQRVAPSLRRALAARAPGATTVQGVRFDRDDRVQVYVHGRGVLGELVAALGTRGVRVERARGGIVQAWVPAARVDEIAALPGVVRVTAPSYATLRTGSVASGGDAVLRADALRALGFDGRNARVGVISDGANDRAAAVASGDLPSDVTVLSECDPAVTQTTCNEGTAMLEIVHDLAPAAELAFCSGFTTLDFQSCVGDLEGIFGANVIVDDLGFFAEPYFQDGGVALAVQSAVNAGVVYVSAAGNDAGNHHEADFVGVTDHFEDDSGAPLLEHDFGVAAGGASDTTMNLTLPPGAVAFATLEWSDPFGGSGNDYDLVLLNDGEDRILVASQDTQNGDDDPLETLAFPNPFGRSIAVKLAVVQVSGAARRVELFVNGDFESLEHVIADGSIIGHPAVPGVLAAAAISASDPGNDDIEPFSSRGPSLVFFPSEASRAKPDVAGIDGVAVTGAGGFSNPFFGTSAAAPHVAGVAALLMGGLSSPTDVVGALRGAAVDLGTAGFDSTFGFGRVDAFASQSSLNVPPSATIAGPASDVSVTVGAAVSFDGTCNDPEGLGGLGFQWRFADSGLADSTAADPGALTFDRAGTFLVTLTCSDAFGAFDPSPATRTVTVLAAGGGGGGGGGCKVTPGESPSALPALLACGLFALASRCKRRGA